MKRSRSIPNNLPAAFLPERQNSQRSGVTLVEVLMSLMIMGIGITSVATLFPISALRSAKATKNTNAALLKYNTEATIKSQPWLVFDPDGDATFGTNVNGLTEHFRNPKFRNYVVDPIGYFTALRTEDIANPPAVIQNTTFGLIPGQNGTFDGDEQFIQDPNSPFFLPRFDGAVRKKITNAQGGSQFRHERAALKLASLGDTWTISIDEFLDSTSDLAMGQNGPIGVIVPDGIDTSDLPVLLGTVSMTLFSVDGRFSEKIPVAGTSTHTDGRDILEWSNTTMLPPAFGGQVGRIVVETKRDSDYHWMLTVRREGDGRTSGVDVVVMFSNGRRPEDERIYPATFVAGVNQIGIGIPSDADPVLKRGGFVFDLQNARWYRISDVEPSPNAVYSQILRVEGTIGAAGGEDQAVLNGSLNDAEVDSNGNGVLDASEDINGDGLWTPAEDRNGNGTLDFGAAVLMPHVVDVFPLGSLPVPDVVIPRNF